MPEPRGAHVRAVAARFAIEGTPETIETHRLGHINDTYFVTTDRGRRYVLQRVNPRVFPDPIAVVENTARVTAHLASRAPGLVPELVRSLDATAAVVVNGETWRMTAFVAGGEIGRLPLHLARAESAGAAFGRFQAALRDYPVSAHVAPIPGFLELAPQYAALDALLAGASVDPARRSRAQRAIDEVESRRDTIATGGMGPSGLIHADCKISNVLFATGESRVLAVIDLDTVMVGRRAWDFGDLVRSAAARGGEDEAGLALDLDRFAALARGFLEGSAESGEPVDAACAEAHAGALAEAPAEAPALAEALVTAPRYITLTLAVRFLVDYLAGDRYFRVDDPLHNLRRAQAQLALVASEQRSERDMERIVHALARRR